MRTQFQFHWFTLPRQTSAPPPPYKMAILTWVTIFPLIALVVTTHKSPAFSQAVVREPPATI
jgi:antibiotic biosynthesis monooxygenase (ABM) superfamily enzyme